MTTPPPRSNRKIRGVSTFRHAITTAAAVWLLTAAVHSNIAAAIDADNTKVNRQDRSGLTPLDQSNSSADTKTVSAIRSAITEDSTLSTNAKNIKVIVRAGSVTLRGPVDSAAERTRVEEIAKNTSGVTSVDNQISIKH